MTIHVGNAIRKSQETHGIFNPIDAINFVIDLLEVQVLQTERDEPYATAWLAEARTALSTMQGLEEFYSEYKEAE